MQKDFIAKNISVLVRVTKLSKDVFGRQFGLNRGAIGSYIDGKSKPKIDTLQKISEKYYISLDDLVNTDISKREINIVINRDKEDEIYSENNMAMEPEPSYKSFNPKEMNEQLKLLRELLIETREENKNLKEEIKLLKTQNKDAI